MRQLFIMDLESTGIGFSDAVLELAFLHLKFDGNFYRPGMYYRRVFHYSFPPESLFSKTHHASLHDECRYADTAIPSEVQGSIIEYFKSCDSTDYRQRIIVGSRLSFKLEMLEKCRYLEKPQLMEFESGPKQTGDYFGIIDLYGVGHFVSEMFEEHRSALQKRMDALNLEMPLPSGHRHRALYDCYVYLNRMNQYRMFFKAPWEFQNAKFFTKN